MAASGEELHFQEDWEINVLKYTIKLGIVILPDLRLERHSY